MEQKKTLWIVAAVGIFLLVVAGAALILYSPSLHRTPVQQASFDPSTGWVSNFPPAQTTTQNQSVPQQEISSQNQAPASPFDKPEGTQAISSANGLIQQPAQKEIRSDNLTVITDNATVYSQETTTIDLNSLKASNTSGVTAQNKFTQDQIASASENAGAKSYTQSAPAENYYAPGAKPQASKPAQTTPAKSTKAVAKSSAPAKAPAAKPAATKTENAAKLAAASKASPDKFWVQPASYATKKNADEARSILESNKITSEVFTFTDSKGKTFYRVRIGPYVTKSEAEYWQSRVAMIDKFADSKSIIVNTKTN